MNNMSQSPRLICFWSGLLSSEYVSSTPVQRSKFIAQQFGPVLFYRQTSSLSIEPEDGMLFLAPKTETLSAYLMNTLGVVQENRDGLGAIYTTSSYSAIAGYLISRKLGIPWVVDLWDHPYLACEGTWHEGRILRSAIHGLIGIAVLRLLKYADGVVCGIHPDALKKYVTDDKLWDVPNGVLLNQVRCIAGLTGFSNLAERGKLQVVYIGYVMRSRGIDTIFDIASATQRRVGNSIIYKIIGPISRRERDWIFRKKGELALENLSLTGALSWRETLNTVAASDVGLYPFGGGTALEYIYPIKVLEYLALGKPVLASAHAGVSRLIENGRNGFLLPDDDPQRWANRLYELSEDPVLFSMLSEEAWKGSERYDWDRVHQPITLELASILTEN